MMKIFISDAVVSKGYDGAPAIRFFNSENGGEFAVFQVGNRKYDSREENNHRWVNLKIKAFGEICERIKKMKLKEGSVVTIFGDYDEERWTDKESKEKRSRPVINLDDIQYSYSGRARKKGRTAERRMEPDKARSRTTQLGSPSRHPILQLDSLNRRRPLLLRLVPCLKALRATRVSVAGTIPISQAEYATGRANKI